MNALTSKGLLLVVMLLASAVYSADDAKMAEVQKVTFNISGMD